MKLRTILFCALFLSCYSVHPMQHAPAKSAEAVLFEDKLCEWLEASAPERLTAEEYHALQSLLGERLPKTIKVPEMHDLLGGIPRDEHDLEIKEPHTTPQAGSSPQPGTSPATQTLKALADVDFEALEKEKAQQQQEAETLGRQACLLTLLASEHFAGIHNTIEAEIEKLAR